MNQTILWHVMTTIQGQCIQKSTKNLIKWRTTLLYESKFSHALELPTFHKNLHAFINQHLEHWTCNQKKIWHSV